MKTHTSGFKDTIKSFGRELDSKITYMAGSEFIELGASQLNSITPHYEGGILKSVMKQLDVDSNEYIPEGTEINYKFGVKVNGSYEYLDFGNYIVYKTEKQEDTDSWKITCYDKMLYAMKDYEDMGITYPITIRNYISAICAKIGLTFENASDVFANYDKEIEQELYLDSNGGSLGYTFRDVLDELAQVTASTICINNDGNLEIRYINLGASEVTTETLVKNVSLGTDVSNAKFKVDTSGYTVQQLTDGIDVDAFESLCTFGPSEDYGQGIMVVGGSMINFFATAYGINILKADGTNFGTADDYHVYIICFDVNEFGAFDGLYIIQDLTENINYGDLPLKDGYAVLENNSTTVFPNNVIWNCMKLTKTTIETETINEMFLKDINVNFENKFGPVNSIVLTRAGGSDSVYLQDEDSVEENGLCEIKIEDNQIMNGNDRADYLFDILEKLDGLEYYVNDFSSTGIAYLELCDGYNIEVGENTYNCVMFNDELIVTQGLEENIHTDMPGEAETEYQYASKDDRKINQTYIIVKKNEGEIEALASSIQDLTDYIKTVEGDSEIELDPVADSDGAIWRLEITGFSELGLYPGMSYPSATNYPSKMTSYIIVTQNEDGTKKNETYIDLGFPLVSTDKLIIENNKVSVLRTGNNLIEIGEEVVLKTFDEKTLISVKYFDNVHLKCQYIGKNEFTKYFSTQTELQSQIQMTSEGITSKVSKAELISEINQSPEKISLTSNRIVIDSEYFKLTEDGKITSTGGTIGGYNISDTQLYAETFARYDYTQRDFDKLYAYIRGIGSLTDEEKEKYDVNGDGELDIADVVLMNIIIKYGVTTTNSAKIIMQTSKDWIGGNAYIIQDGYGNNKVSLGLQRSMFNQPLYLKANDRDISINNLINYKEGFDPNEYPIGTWYDGKPIYRIVVFVDSLSTGTSTIYQHEIEDAETVWCDTSNSYIKWSNGATAPFNYIGGSSSNSTSIEIRNVSTTGFEIDPHGVDRSGLSAVVTLNYTKTTD